MNEKEKKQINDALELMNSICYSHRFDDGGLCNATCPLWWICTEYVFDMRKLD